MGYLDQVQSSRRQAPRRCFVYGVEGIGKSTWAAQWPKPLFLPTEDGLAHLDVPSLPLARTLQQAWEPIFELSDPNNQHDFETLVIDTADWLENLVNAAVVRAAAQNANSSKRQIKTVADISYGRGTEAVKEKFLEYLRTLDACRARGMHIVILAHSDQKRIEPPDNLPYDKYAPKLHVKVAKAICEWADEVLFCNYKVYTQTQEMGFGRERAVATGVGERVMYTMETPTHAAKNRLGLPEEIPMDFSVFERYLTGSVSKNAKEQVDVDG